jgi:SAM-dependent methyltransferase
VSTSEFIRYLQAKKGIDDRSLNARVWQASAEALSARQRGGPVQVLELGCGIGTMLERALEWELFGGIAEVHYIGVDLSAESIAEARRRLPDWSGRLGFAITRSPEHDVARRDDLHLQIRWFADDAFAFAADPARAGAFDLLLSHALLDLLDARRAVQAFLPLLHPGGLFYFSLVFDGVTVLEPVLDLRVDAQIERLYHQTMDRRLVDGQPSGQSRTGRSLFTLLPQAGGRILDAGSSDWIVFPRAGTYRPDETLLLDHILSTMAGALADHPELDPGELEHWLAQRRAQRNRGELTYLAHQLDFLGEYLPSA